MEQLTARLIEFWNSLSRWQRFVVLGIPAVVIIGAVAALTALIGAPPAQAVMYSGLEPADAGLIIDELEKQNVSYDLLNEGRDIAVPADQMYRLRLSLAQQGLPRGHVGFELFDKPKMGITDQGMQMDKQIATQGELARNLESLEQVSKASVILAIAPETSFLDNDAHSTASVTLTLNPGERLNEQQVEGIRHLVSRAVPRLEPEDVTITDSRANPLTGREDAEGEQRLAGMELAELRQELLQRVERRYENKIRQVLEDVYGLSSVAAAVTLEMDTSLIKTQSKEYTPVTSDEQGIESRVEEHRSRSGTAQEDLGGIPGTTSNVPGYLGISAGETTGGESSEYDLIVDYLVNEKLSEEELWPGAITRRSAAVALNTDTWDDSTKASVEELVANAIGADPAAGDAIYVQGFIFSDREAGAVATQYIKVARTRMVSGLATLGAVIALVVFALFFLRSLVLGGLPRQMLTPAPPVETAGKRVDLSEEEAEEFALRRLDELGTTQQEKMRQEISRMVDTEPDRVVALLRSWMLEDT